MKNSIDTIGDRTRDLPTTDLRNYKTAASSRQKLNQTRARAHTQTRTHIEHGGLMRLRFLISRKELG
jgi:hypothetical protein